MANKFTKAVDAFFKRWMEDDAKIIPLFNCHSGDEDGGTDDYEWTDWWETEEMWEVDGAELNDNYFDDKDACHNDWDKLTDLFYSSFHNALESNFSGTNCYWHRYYYITRDYQIKATVERSICDVSADGLNELVLDFGAYSEKNAEMVSDNDKLESIDVNVNAIERLIGELEHDESKAKACQKLLKLVYQTQKSMPVQSYSDIAKREG